MQHPERHLVRKWHVLIAGAGTLAPTELYGRALIADARLVGKYVGQDTLRLEFNDPEGDQALFAYAYLASPTGLRALRSASYGTKILRIRRDVLSELPVPRVDDATLSRVAKLVRAAVQKREAYVQELRTARTVVESLPVMQAAHAMCAERKAHAVSWSGPMQTLGAWNYASTGGALGFLLRSWSGRLREIVSPEAIFRGGRYQRVTCEPPHGIDFLNQRDVFSIRPIPRRVTCPAVPMDWIYVPEHTLLVGGQGTLGESELFGQVALATPDLSASGITEHLLRIQAKDFGSNSLLYAFLSTLVPPVPT